MSEPDGKPLRFESRAAFRAWAEQQPRGRWERERGVVVTMAPERIDHVRIKARVWRALSDAIEAAGLPCEAFNDGVTVEVGEGNDYEPDAVVTCGGRSRGNDTAVSDPVIIVEVLSPSTGYRDTGVKLDEYFGLPSVQHYLLLSSNARRVIYHFRLEPGKLLTGIYHEGPIDLTPPGIRIEVADLYAGTDLTAPGQG